MPSLKEFRRRIVSVKSTRQITRAMKLVAAAKLRRSQERIVELRPYAYSIRDMVAEVAIGNDAEAHPLLETREPRKTLLLVLTSDRGLAGAFNTNINKLAYNWCKDHVSEREHIELHVVGRKGRDYFKRREFELGKVHVDVLPEVNFQKATRIGRELVASYIDGDFDEVWVVYNEFKSAIAQEPTLEKLLPIEPTEAWMDEHQHVSSDTLFEPTRNAVLDALLPLHIHVQLFRAMLESVASEMGARMTAMDNATNNATDLLDRLTVQYNRARQAAITTELMEITSGAEALKG
jgi:F-type H+-transporting ATPase subunit gamma